MIISLSAERDALIGERIYEFKKDYSVIDIETTGLNPGYDTIIELAAIKVRDNIIVDKFSSLVNPNIKISSFITSLTGITNEMLQYAPSLDTVLPEFISFIKDDIVIGHNVTFDLHFISTESLRLLKKDFINNYINTLPLSRKIFPEVPSHRLSFLAEYLNICHPTHRATYDCLATKELYDAIYKTASEKCIDPFKKINKYHAKPLQASDITTQKDEFDEFHPLYNKLCVFTGALTIPRREAMQMVADVGGQNGDRITQNTDFLIVGTTDYISNLKGEKSSKLKKAESLIQKGFKLQILTEHTFMQLVKNK